MGGQAAAGSFARSWQEDPTSLRTQRSMAVRTDREKLAMNDALYQEGMKQFKEKGKLSQSHVDAVNQFSKFGSKPKMPLPAPKDETMIPTSLYGLKKERDFNNTPMGIIPQTPEQRRRYGMTPYDNTRS
jgi:hypothetical protein